MGANETFPILELREFQFNLESDYSLLYHRHQGKNIIEKPHKHDFFLLFLIEKGSGTHTIDFVEHRVSDHQLHILFPDQIHKWELGEQTSGFQLMVSKRVFETFSTNLRFSFMFSQSHSVIDLSEDIFKALLYEFERLKYELDLHPVHWDIVYSRSKLIAQLVTREAEDRFEDIVLYRTHPILLKYRALIDSHYKEEKTVTFYANELHISANYLNILCKTHLRVSALYLIQNRVILEAKRLVHASQKSIKEISYDLGFNDLAYFSNFFKSQTGISPRQFREQL
jgi:AraC family transcriptional activator of pobA